MSKFVVLYVYLAVLFHLTSVQAVIDVYDPNGKKVESFRDRDLLCGEDFDPIQGFLVLSEPPDACSKISGPLFNFSTPKFVIINGTESCPLTTKIRNAEKAGYQVAVIFDPAVSPFQCIHIGPDMDIPVVYVNCEDGVTLKNNYLYNMSRPSNYILLIRPNSPDMRYYMYLFGGVVGVCFFVMLIFMICLLVKCLQERRRNRRNRLSSRQIKQIPTAKFSKGDQYDVCAICLEDYNEGDKLRILPCSHAYHARCIDPWLMNNRRNCPLCKRKITLGDANSESDSEDSELTSPTENTPLITTPLNRGMTWGTFSVNPVNPINVDVEVTVSSSSTNRNGRRLAEEPSTATMSEDEPEDLVASARCSVNTSNEDCDTPSNGNHRSVVHVACETEGLAASSQHGLIV